jgi:hypothetical protein
MPALVFHTIINQFNAHTKMNATKSTNYRDGSALWSNDYFMYRVGKLHLLITAPSYVNKFLLDRKIKTPKLLTNLCIMIENKQTEESCTIALNNNFLQD